MIFTIIGIVFMLALFVFVYTRQPKGHRVSLLSCLIAGLLGAIPAFFISFYFQIFTSAFVLKYIENDTLRKIIEYFLVVALSEELLKFISGVIVSKKTCTTRSNYITVFAAAGVGFDIFESSFQMGDGLSMIVRCVLAIHISLQICMAGFYSKGHKVLALVVPIIIHGLYDFGLSDGLSGLFSSSAEDGVILILVVALGGIAFLVWSMIFANSVGKQDKALLEKENKVEA